MKDTALNILLQQGLLSPIDIHFAGLMARLSGGGNAELHLAAALVSGATREGHICLNLNRSLEKIVGEGEGFRCPEPQAWGENLLSQDVVGRPGDFTPLILDDQGRLYLFRYWEYQEKLALRIGRLIRKEMNVDLRKLKEGLERLFPVTEAEEIDWQKIAAFTATVRNFCVISGGPGTGKTTTVAKILALLIGQRSSREFRMALAAPTGKGAARLEEAIRESKEKLDCAEEVKKAIPESASTVHRLLGSILGSPYFRYDARHPLPLDVVVVDEASMVDLALMSKLVQALPAKARLILLGDKDQLASVEAGAVLGDICDTGRTHGFSARFASKILQTTGYELGGGNGNGMAGGIRDAIVELKKNYRFDRRSGIYAISRAVNDGEGDRAMALLKEGRFRDIVWKDLRGFQILAREFRDAVLKGFRDCFAVKEPHEIFCAFERFRILCALRKGPCGVHAVNRSIEKIFQQEGIIRPDSKGNYAGRPILVTRNDYGLGLFNGDMGIILPDSGNGNRLRAFFPGARDGLRKFHPLMLPEHETVFAMTVHKSQGSEFVRVLLLLPERDFPLLTRELLYTGMTRARETIELWTSEQVFKTAVSRRIERTSGLRDALWGASKAV